MVPQVRVRERQEEAGILGRSEAPAPATVVGISGKSSKSSLVYLTFLPSYTISHTCAILIFRYVKSGSRISSIEVLEAEEGRSQIKGCPSIQKLDPHQNTAPDELISCEVPLSAGDRHLQSQIGDRLDNRQRKVLKPIGRGLSRASQRYPVSSVLK